MMLQMSRRPARVGLRRAGRLRPSTHRRLNRQVQLDRRVVADDNRIRNLNARFGLELHFSAVRRPPHPREAGRPRLGTPR